MDRAEWWNDQWDALASDPSSPDDGRPSRVGTPVDDRAVGRLTTAPDVLALWPRLTHAQRRAVLERARRGTIGLVPGPLLACFAAQAPDHEISSVVEDERDELRTLVGLPLDLTTVQLLAGDPAWVAGPLAATAVGTRMAAGFAGSVGRELRQQILDTAALSHHLTYIEATRILTSDPRLVLARGDAPFADVIEGYSDPGERSGLTRDAEHDWRVAKHPDCPQSVVVRHVETAGYLTALHTLATPVSDAYVGALLWHPQKLFRRLVTRRMPARVVHVMHASMPAARWRRLADDCPPSDPEYLEAYTTHPQVQVRTSYVRAYPDHPVVAQRALADSNRWVRAALLHHTTNGHHIAALARDPSPAIRRDAAQALLTAMSRTVGSA